MSHIQNILPVEAGLHVAERGGAIRWLDPNLAFVADTAYRYFAVTETISA